jgi:ASC-1-like (ASCH) protein
MRIWKKIVHDPYFRHLINGSRCILGRLGSDDWLEMNVGDKMVISNLEGRRKSFLIVSLHYVHSFSYLQEKYPTRLLQDYKLILPRDDAWEKKYGVVGINLRSTNAR